MLINKNSKLIISNSINSKKINNLKKIYTFFIVIYCQCFYGQLQNNLSYETNPFEKFLTTTTRFVLSGDKDFDTLLTKQIEENWKITPYEILSNTLTKKDKLKKGYSYAIYLKQFTKPFNTNQETHYYGVFLGHDNAINDYSYQDIMSYTPLDFYGTEPKFENLRTRLPVVIFNLQNSFLIAENLNLDMKFLLKMVKKYSELYNENSGVLKNKKLLINEKRAKLTKEEFKEIYKYDFEYVAEEMIEKVINERDSNYAILHLACTINKSIFVFDAQTYMPLYFDYSPLGFFVNKGDVNNLNKCIENNNNDKIKYNYLEDYNTKK